MKDWWGSVYTYLTHSFYLALLLFTFLLLRQNKSNKRKGDFCRIASARKGSPTLKCSEYNLAPRGSGRD